MLRKGTLIPPLTIRNSHGPLVSAWDYKQKRNLIIAFLDEGCSTCERFVKSLIAYAEDFRQREAVALLVFPQEPGSAECSALPAEIIAGTDVDGSGIQRYLGENALSTRGQVRKGIFITDRYGELYDLWWIEGHGFPTIEQILSSLDAIELICDECGAPYEPLDE